MFHYLTEFILVKSVIFSTLTTIECLGLIENQSNIYIHILCNYIPVGGGYNQRLIINDHILKKYISWLEKYFPVIFRWLKLTCKKITLMCLFSIFTLFQHWKLKMCLKWQTSKMIILHVITLLNVSLDIWSSFSQITDNLIVRQVVKIKLIS